MLQFKMSINSEAVLDFTREVFERTDVPIEIRIKDFMHGIHLPSYVNRLLWEKNLKELLPESRKLGEWIKREIEKVADNEESNILEAFLHDFWNIICYADYLTVLFDDDTINDFKGKTHTFDRMYGWRVKTIGHLRGVIDKLVSSSGIKMEEWVDWDSVSLSREKLMGIVRCLHEICINYVKYGKDWTLSIKRWEKNTLGFALSNAKKSKPTEYFGSSNKWVINIQHIVESFWWTIQTIDTKETYTISMYIPEYIH